MRYKILLIIILQTGFLKCIYGNNIAMNGSSWQRDGRSMGMGGGMNAIEQDSSDGISVNYLLPYQLKALSTRSLKMVHQTKWMNIEGSWAQTGDEVFLENYLTLGASRHLSGSFTLKVKAGFYRYSLVGGEKGSTVLSEMNVHYKLCQEMEINVYLFNPTGSEIRRLGNKIPVYPSFHLGGTFCPTKKVEGVFEFEKTQTDKMLLHLGLEYSLSETFIIRTGISSKPTMPSWGIGGKIQRFNYAFGANSHPVLGFSSCFSLSYHW